MKRVILILEYDMGFYDDDYDPPKDPNEWREVFEQSDIYHDEMKIIGVRIEDRNA